MYSYEDRLIVCNWAKFNLETHLNNLQNASFHNGCDRGGSIVGLSMH